MEIDFEPSRDLFPFESQWFDSEVGRVHYVDEGSGRPILFLHGNPTWSFLYRGIIRRLKYDYRCIAIDYPGFGLSTRPDEGYGYTPREHTEVVSDLVEALDLEDLIVMGQDWGGPIGMATALNHPERVSGFVFGNTWFWPTDRTLNKLFGRVMSTKLLRWAILERNLFVDQFIPIGSATDLPSDVMKHYRAVQPTRRAREGVAEFARQLIESRDWLREIADGVERELSDRPTLLTWGMLDLAFSPKYYLPRFTETFDDATTIPLPDAKHFIQEDAPARIAEAIFNRFERRSGER